MNLDELITDLDEDIKMARQEMKENIWSRYNFANVANLEFTRWSLHITNISIGEQK